jgi:hypothetical protein
MTGPDHETRPISVAELLARNGTIGAPPIGGRRRRRRGDSEAVTVAELTGEIPTVGEDEHDYEAEIDERADHDGGSSVAEQMRPDPLIADGHDEDTGDALLEEPTDDEDDDLPAYLRSIRTPLFGGPTRDEPRRDVPGPATEEAADAPAETTAEDLDEHLDEHLEHGMPTPAQKVLRAGLIVLQSMVAVAFGAGLFIAFEQLWKWNNIVALVLSVLVILGLVVAVRVVRKTEDIASTLIAVAVGALVTLGPLALLQSG